MKSYSEVQTDGGADIIRQITAQRQKIADRLSSIKNILAVASGKGGVGKSTVSYNLALAYARRGFKVGILDADLNGPSQARLAALRSENSALWVPEKEGLSIPRNSAGLKVLSLGSLIPDDAHLELETVARSETQTWRATKEFSLIAQILSAAVWGELDLLLIDLPPGAERVVQFAHFFGSETAFLLVTIPSELSRGVVERSFSALAQTPNKVIGLVENMSAYLCPHCKTEQPLFESKQSATSKLPLLVKIPFDPELASYSDLGKELAADSTVAQIFKELSIKVDDLLDIGVEHEISMC